MQMSKFVGATTFGAIVLTGFLFQAKYGVGPVAGQQNSAPPSQSATKPLPGEGRSEGPWIASCKYWAAVHSLDSPAAGGASPDLAVTGNTSGKGAESHLESRIESPREPAPASEPPCGPGDGWGIPPTTS